MIILGMKKLMMYGGITKMTIYNPKYDKRTAIFTELCSLYESNNSDFYYILDGLVTILNDNQLEQVKQLIVNGEVEKDDYNPELDAASYT